MTKTILSSLIIILLLLGCKKDNYEKPSSVLSGKVVYNKEALGLRSNGVQLELWQHGYQLFTKIPVFVAQDGSFSVSLFDGTYKLVQLQGNGPWVNNIDSIDVTVNGNTTVDVPVQPYFILKSAAVTKSGTEITATVSIENVAAGQPLESVSLYAGKTNIVDQVNSQGAVTVNAADITDITQPITLKMTIPAGLSAEGYFFARVGVKTAGIAESVYGAPIKVE